MTDFEAKRGDQQLLILLGELKSDVRNVLRSIDRNNTELHELRVEHREAIGKVKARLAVVERFNLRLITYTGILAAVFVPASVAVVNYGIPWLLKTM